MDNDAGAHASLHYAGAASRGLGVVWGECCDNPCALVGIVSRIKAFGLLFIIRALGNCCCKAERRSVVSGFLPIMIVFKWGNMCGTPSSIVVKRLFLRFNVCRFLRPYNPSWVTRVMRLLLISSCCKWRSGESV